MVVAASRYAAEDACDRIRVVYAQLPPVVGIAAARAAEHLVHEDVPGNVAAVMLQEVGDARAAIAAAPRRLVLDLEVERSASMPLEGKGVHARWDPDDDSLRVHTSTQAATSVRAAIAAKLGAAAEQGRGGRRRTSAAASASRSSTRGRRSCWCRGRRARSAAGASGPRTGASTSSRRRTSAPRCTTSRSGSTTTVAARARRHVLARQRRLHAVRDHRADHHVDPAARAVQAGRLPGRVHVALHEHRDRHAVPRRGPAAGLLRHGADHGRDRRRARARPGRGPRAATSSSRTRCRTTTR